MIPCLIKSTRDTFKQESYFINKTISSTKLPSPTQSFKKGYEEVCLKLLSKVKHFIFVFTIKMWQNDKICFLKIFTWHPKKDQNFNCAFEDDKWRVFPNTFNPFISSDWQIEFCELHSFWIVALKKVTLLSPCILCFEIWNEKVYNKHFRYRFI